MSPIPFQNTTYTICPSLSAFTHSPDNRHRLLLRKVTYLLTPPPTLVSYFFTSVPLSAHSQTTTPKKGWLNDDPKRAFDKTMGHRRTQSFVHSYYAEYHHSVDLFFSGLSAEEKTYSLSAHPASAKRAVKNILSLIRIAKLGPSRL